MIEVTDEMQMHLDNLRGLRQDSGLFLAAGPDVPTGYDKAWLRDNFYTTLAFERVGDWDTVKKTWRAILDIFIKHKDKIDWAIEHSPHESWQYIHARYNPETFDEYWEEWGNKQNDAIGAILFKFCECHSAGLNILDTEEDREMVQKLVYYLNSVEYWHTPDNGVWEEYEEVHASSVGACVAGLGALEHHDDIDLPDGIIESGRTALNELLPRESQTKFVDLAQLSLIYPYNLLSREQEDIILERIHYHYDRDRGVIRYKNDHYYNANEDGYSEEAEWVFGFPWLAIIYARRGDLERAEYYIDKTRKLRTENGMLPELYYSNRAEYNENVPLAWTESMFVVALVELEQARTQM